METNKPTTLDYQSLNFAALLEEGMFYVNANTPTRFDNNEGCTTFAKLLSDKLEEYVIPHKIYDLILCSNPNHNHFTICIDNTLFISFDGILNHIAGEVKKILISKEELNKTVENLSNDTSFDKDCISGINRRFDDVFKQIGNFEIGSFKNPESIEYTKKTKEGLNRERQNALKRMKDMFKSGKF